MTIMKPARRWWFPRTDTIKKRQIIPVSSEERQAHPTHTRDPKVWREEDRYYMVLGSTFREETGRIVFYTNRDGVEWKFANQVKDEKLGRILECPDLFKIGEQYVFMGSLMYIGDKKCGYEHHAVCTEVFFEPAECKLTISGECRYIYITDLTCMHPRRMLIRTEGAS